MEAAPARPPWAGLVMEAMAARQLPASVLAEELGLSPRAWSARLAGRVRPLTSEIASVGRILGLPVEDLVAASAGPAGPDLELLTDRDRRVYRASGLVDGGNELADLEEVQAYVDAVLLGPWWAIRAPDVTEVRVFSAAGDGQQTPAWHEPTMRAGRVSHTVHFPPWARRPLTVLHELAHVAAHPILWAKPHGPQWIRLWVDLVGSVMGRAAAGQLRSALRDEGLGMAPAARVAAERSRGNAELERLLGTGGGEG